MRNRTWKQLDHVVVGTDGTRGQVYVANRLRAIVSRDGPGEYWHISISHADGRYPTWDEIADARYDLIPLDVDMALILPPPEDYTNHHPTVLQLTEVRDPDMPIDRATGQVRTRHTLLGTPGKEAYR